jgi:nucleotide-binding universal stress UspA family protein
VFLVAYDGSAASKRALEHAAGLAGRRGDVAVINVIPAQSVSARLQTVTETEWSRQSELLREAKALLARRRIDADLIEAVGDPATEIIAAAETMNAETIVVGRSPRRHLVHEGLAARLVRDAKADVLVVH